MSADVDALFSGAKAWRAEKAKLRSILKALPLTEGKKWGKACYAYEGGSVCLIMSLKGYCALGFLKGALLKDPEGRLVAPGANSRAMRQLRFTDVSEIDARVVKAYVTEAIALEQAGARVDFSGAEDPELPAELTAALADDPEYAAAFAALTPGRRRGYALHVGGAKQSATRAARAARCRDKVMAGLGFNERPKTKAAAKPAGAKATPRLLAGGNPQIPKGDGEAPVQAYLAAMPGWTRAVGERLDALVTAAVPGVTKGVRWNSPFYGVEGQGWFLSFHCFDRYVKVTFFRGADLEPPPPEPSKDPLVRYAHVREADEIDARVWKRWIRQAAALPGWIP